MIVKYQGETIKKSVGIYNADGTPATLTSVTMAAGIGRDGVVTAITPTKSGNVVTARFTNTATMLGIYHLEIKVKDTSTDIETISRELVLIKESLIPNFT